MSLLRLALLVSIHIKSTRLFFCIAKPFNQNSYELSLYPSMCHKVVYKICLCPVHELFVDLKNTLFSIYAIIISCVCV